MAASSEKEDMVCLNDRLGDVVAKVEKLRSGSGVDSSTFLKAIDCLKEEIKKIKTAYDLEISRLRSDCRINTFSLHATVTGYILTCLGFFPGFRESVRKMSLL